MVERTLFALMMTFLLVVQGTAQTEYVRESKSSDLIVFVHGVGSSVRDAFTNEKAPGKPFWPEIVKDDPVFRNSDIVTYEYPSPKLNVSYDVRELTMHMANTLASTAVNITRYQRVLFVTHSLGGLVTRSYLMENEDIRSRTKAVFMFAPPMNGSSIASVATYLSRNPSIIDLKLPRDKDAFVVNLRHRWINLGLNIPAFCAYELQAAYKLKIVVDRQSVEPLCNNAIEAVDADHFTIVKPTWSGATMSGDTVKQPDDAKFVAPGEYPHQLLQRWYARIYPEAVDQLNVSEVDYPVVLANCSGEKYNRNFNPTLVGVSRSAGYPARISYKLPWDWKAGLESLLWTQRDVAADGSKAYEPQLLVVHLSCFMEGPGSDEDNAERTSDFIALLESLKDTKIKILVYSRAFGPTPNFLAEFVPPDLLKKYQDEKRLFPLRLKFGDSDISSNRDVQKLFSETIKKAFKGG
jgi:pimeloyl-ACP methyl ester carboxylesterase